MRKDSIFSEPCIDTGPSGDAVIESLAALAKISSQHANPVSDRLGETATDWTTGAERVENHVIANEQLAVVVKRWGHSILGRLEGPEAPPIVPGDPNNLRIFTRRRSKIINSNEDKAGDEGIVSITALSAAEADVIRSAMTVRSEPSICDGASEFLKASRSEATEPDDTSSESPENITTQANSVIIKIGHRVTGFTPTGINPNVVGHITGF